MRLLACVLLALLPGMMLGELVQCPEKTVMQNFDFSRFQGHWYIIMRNEDLTNAKCHQHFLRAENDTTSIITFKYFDITEGRNTWMITNASIRKTDSSGKLLVTDLNDAGRGRPYWILDTDYDKYAVIYSCRKDASNVVEDKIRVLSRTTDLPQEVTAAVNSILQANNMAGRMFTTSHDCPAE